MKIDKSKYEPIEMRKGNLDKGEKKSYYYLYRNKNDSSFVEVRPLKDEIDRNYSGGPTEIVKVTAEYVKEHYPDVKTNGN